MCKDKTRRRVACGWARIPDIERCSCPMTMKQDRIIRGKFFELRKNRYVLVVYDLGLSTLPGVISTSTHNNSFSQGTIKTQIPRYPTMIHMIDR